MNAVQAYKITNENLKSKVRIQKVIVDLNTKIAMEAQKGNFDLSSEPNLTEQELKKVQKHFVKLGYKTTVGRSLGSNYIALNWKLK